ncbi:mitotic spindle assembly checkpoint protein MAD2 [Angomonas deanei]|nr:mitotic spindle assembly checkpoint protein MAD2 [Angomonas deanei]|eukprot:EPY40357.1 mitotic spindle assembly checkpoint protein MAD2 [Angomonas deanei]
MSQVAQAITLTGSTALVTEYFGFAMNSILYQRGVYPAEQFTLVHKYGIPLYITNNEKLSEYMGHLLQQVIEWISGGECSRLVLLLLEAETEVVVERWEFVLEQTSQPSVPMSSAYNTKAAQVMYNTRCPPGGKKSEEEVRRDIQGVMRQITSCVSFLPTLSGKPLVFDVLVYTTATTTAPADGSWELSDPKLIEQGSVFHLKSFHTSHHGVNTAVSFKE